VISRRRIRHVIALLLPLMVLRALLPAGFMPVAEHGELRMVMCSAGLALPGTDHSGKGTQDHTGSDSCPFAHAAASAPPTQHVVAITEPLREVRFLSLAIDTLPPATGPPRTAAARAPPALSAYI
jgi:hypothetical protein